MINPRNFQELLDKFKYAKSREDIDTARADVVAKYEEVEEEFAETFAFAIRSYKDKLAALQKKYEELQEKEEAHHQIIEELQDQIASLEESHD